MNSSVFLEKVSKANKKIPYFELRKTFFKFPITRYRKLNNLDLVLTCGEVSQFQSAEDLIFFIENKSLELEINDFRIKKRNKRKILESELAKEAVHRSREEKLFNSILKANGLDSSGNKCVSCGIQPMANGFCKC